MARHNKDKARKRQAELREQAMKDGRKRDFWNAMLAVAGLVVVYGVTLLQGDKANPFDAYLSAQATLGGLFANVLAVLSITYGKATTKFDVCGRTYFLSMLGFVVVALVFAQAVFMVYPNVRLFAEFMRSKWVFVILNLLFLGMIFVISFSKGLPEYTKETIKN